MDKYVTFVGRKTKEEISNILLDHNIFVIASLKETFCIPGIEALASGMPVVSTKCLGPEEYIDETCGKLVGIGDYEELAESIIYVYEHLNDYNLHHLREIADHYNSASVVKKALAIYEKIRR